MAPAAGRLVLADHNPDVLAGLQQQLAPASLFAQRLDVTDRAAVGAFFRVPAQNGCAHFCFYVAGILTIESYADTSPQSWDRVVAVNLNGAFYCTKAASDVIKSNDEGVFSCWAPLREQRLARRAGLIRCTMQRKPRWPPTLMRRPCN